MKLYKKIFIIALIQFLIFAPIIKVFAEDADNISGLAAQNYEIDRFIQKKMSEGKIPGMSVVIVKGNETIYEKCFGYADVGTKEPVTSDTLFEMGSISKTFTGLGTLSLEEKGKLSLDDSVSKYIPWFNMKYEGKEANITINQLLHHTSGIPYETLDSFDESIKDNALEEAVRKISGMELDHSPDEKYLYASMNYDILGLIIQNVSGQLYEDYMRDNILKPLGLNHTYLSREEAASQGKIATGYKMSFGNPVAYNAPMYRGNTPAAYYITDIKDLSKWIKVQLESKGNSSFGNTVIEESHVPNRDVAPASDGSSYACGWFVFQEDGGEVCHPGLNPNYSSIILFNPEKKIGVGVLTNIATNYAEYTGHELMSFVAGKKFEEKHGDMFTKYDKTAMTVIFIIIPFALLTLWAIISLIIKVCKKKRRFEGKKVTAFLGFILAISIFSLGFGYFLYSLPKVMRGAISWNFITVWLSPTLSFAALTVFFTVLLFYSYFLLTVYFPKPDGKSFFQLSVLSIVGGFANAFIIFLANEAVSRNGGFEWGLFLYFMIGILIYIYSQKVVRTRIIGITHNLVYTKRMELLGKILRTSYRKFEMTEEGAIHAGLNNDTEALSNFTHTVVTAVTSAITLLCCFAYLGVMNLKGLLVLLVAVAVASGLYFILGRVANRLWEQAREIQNIFFKFINSLLHGFKELSLHRRKRNEFEKDMMSNCEAYRDKRIKADLEFSNAFISGELLLTFILGVVVFIFPVIFKEIKEDTLRLFMVVFLYMIGPFRNVLNSIPSILQMRISWNRLRELSEQLSSIELMEEEDEQYLQHLQDNKKVLLELKDFSYTYKTQNGDVFTLGPIDYSFKSGEIVFITGGNGTGKSTLGKLITGLYTPDSGEILLNGKNIHPKKLGENFSAIFSDHYLFERLYGIDFEDKKEEIEKYLKLFKLDDKVKIKNGVFSTVKLSTGQIKRLALLISYLEDRPIYLFDEWAADQDPVFREIFYRKLLPEMKHRGKCVIAVTHDDRYFDAADRVIKMYMGKIMDDEEIMDSSANAIA